MQTILFALMGLGIAPLCLWILNQLPDKAFCDYDETPEGHHVAPRFGMVPYGIGCGIVLATVYTLLFLRFGWNLAMLPLCLFVAILVMIALSDIKFTIIPDELLVAGAVCAFFAVLPDALASRMVMGWILPFLGAPLGAGMVLLLNLLGRLIYKKDAVGMGDLKLLTVCGLALGAGGTVIAGLLAVLSAGVVFAVLMLLKRMKSDQYVPFGPWLVLGTMLTLCFRPVIDRVVAWYLSLL